MPSVVTRVGDGAGNLALALVQFEAEQPDVANDFKGRYVSAVGVIGGLAMNLRQEVFQVGEVLVFDADDRDQFGRKPDKWPAAEARVRELRDRRHEDATSAFATEGAE